MAHISWQERVEIYDASGRLVRNLKVGALGVPDHVVYSPDGRLLATDGWMNIFVYSASDGAKLRKLPLGGTCTGLAWSPDSHAIVAARGALVQIIGAEDGCKLAEVALDSRANAIAVSPDAASFAVACDDHTARVFDLTTGAEIARIPRGAPVTGVAFAANGRLVLVDESGSLQVRSAPVAG